MKVLPVSGDYCTMARIVTCTLNGNVCDLYNILFPSYVLKAVAKHIIKNSLLLSSWKK